MTSRQCWPFLTYQETQITKLVKVTVEKLQWEKYDCVISLNYFVRYKGMGVLVATLIQQTLRLLWRSLCRQPSGLCLSGPHRRWDCDLSYISALLACLLRQETKLWSFLQHTTFSWLVRSAFDFDSGPAQELSSKWIHQQLDKSWSITGIWMCSILSCLKQEHPYCIEWIAKNKTIRLKIRCFDREQYAKYADITEVGFLQYWVVAEVDTALAVGFFC